MYIKIGDYMKIFKLLILLLIVSFLGLYFAYINGYSDKIINDKVTMTNQKIEEFEQDILNGEEILLESYLDVENNYSTKASNMSLKLSSKIENIIDSSIKFIFRKISGVVE